MRIQRLNGDLKVVVLFWGTSGDLEVGSPDLNDDGLVNVNDLLAVIGNWGACPKGPGCLGDIVITGQVDTLDLQTIVTCWTPTEPIERLDSDNNGILDEQDIERIKEDL